MEEARQIFLDACVSVAAAFEPDGFRWRKSKTDIVKKDGNLTFAIQFQTSPRNRLLNPNVRIEIPNEAARVSSLFYGLKKKIRHIYSFGSVAFRVHLTVEDEVVGKWRTTLPRAVGVGSMVASTNVGYLSPEDNWLDLNLAQGRLRDKHIKKIIDLVRGVGFSYFDRFRNPRQVVQSIIEGSFQGMLDFHQVEYAVYYGSQSAGRQVIQRCFGQWPGSEEEYRATIQDYQKNGIPERGNLRPDPDSRKPLCFLG